MVNVSLKNLIQIFLLLANFLFLYGLKLCKSEKTHVKK